MHLLPRVQRAASATGPARNDPCPCGSGRKFKHCCAGKPASTADAQPGVASVETERQRIRELRDAGRFLEAIRLAHACVVRNPLDTAAHNELGLLYLHAGRTAEAIPPLSQALRLAPKEASHHYNLGCALELLGYKGDAIARFRQTVTLAPRDPNALERLGNLLLAFDQRTEATELFRRAAAAAPNTLAGRLNHAKALVEEARPAEAEAFLRQTIALYPTAAEAHRFLATILRERGSFDEAILLLEQATEGDATQAANAYSELAHSKRVTADDQPMLDQMHALLRQPTLPEKYRVPVHFGLCKAFNDLGRYEEAMQEADTANRLARQGTTFDRAHLGASMGRLIATFTREALVARPVPGPQSETPVFILGMPRSGTTLVEQIVSSHPQVGAGGELTFWNHEAAAFARQGEADPNGAYLAQVASKYEAALHRIAPDARRVTDKAPGNFLWIGLIHLTFPRARFLHCRRHPVDTCLSNYFTNFAALLPFTLDKGHLAFYYRWYERLMAHWRAALPSGVLLDVDYEELVANPESVTRRMIDFIGLEWDDACLRPEDNRNMVRTASMWQARQPTYRSSTERWRRYEPWLGELRSLLEAEDPDAVVQPVSDHPNLPAARRLRDAGRFDEAIEMLHQAVRRNPNDPVIYSDLGALCLTTNRVESAVDCFEKAIGLNPNFATAHYNLGAALERQGRQQQATATLRRAIALLPTLGEAHSRLGNLLQAAGEREEANKCFRRAAGLLTGPGERDLEDAKLLLAEGRPSEAEPRLRRVLALDPANSLAPAMLGDLLGESGRFEEAIALLRKATEIDPTRVGAWHNLAILTKVSDADHALVEQMSEMLEQAGRTEFDRALLHFALGKMQDDLGEYAQAIRHYDQANELERRKLAFDRSMFVTEIDRLIETFTPDRFTRRAALGTEGEVPLCIVGMPRSGTTLVEQIVSAHPAVAGGGELTFWNDQGAAAYDLGAVAGFAAGYLALLRRIGPQAARVTDKNPFNFLWIGLIHLALPQARFIHCRRDPIDTCLSVFFTRFATPQPFAYDRGDLVFYYRQYQRLMAHWRTVLPPDRLLEVDYEALTADPEPLTRRMIEFCGLDWNDACLAPERNQRVVRTASVWQARQPVYRSSVARWRNYEPWLGELAALHSGVE
jgi:tetratricopeptide (TPR) repeat protein